MGFFDGLRNALRLSAHSPTLTFDSAIDDEAAAAILGFPLADDWTSPDYRIDRARAMSVPAVKRARDLICGTIGRLPMYLQDSEFRRSTNALLIRPEADKPRVTTMTRTVEDMLFEGVAWWRITQRVWTGFPMQVEHVRPWRVSVNDAGEVRIDGKLVPHADLIRFDSPNDPLLVAGARAIRTCLKLDSAAAMYADEPRAQAYFTPAEGADPADDEDVKDVLNEWKAARQTRTTAYVPAAIKLNEVTQFSPEQLQLADSRQHAVLEIARAAGVDPKDLGVAMDSNTYNNGVDRRRDFIDFTLGSYVEAIEGVLSGPNVTPRGYEVQVDYLGFTRANEKERMEGYQLALDMGLVDRPEIRRREEIPVPTERPAMPAPTPLRALPVAASADESGLTFSDDDRLILGFASDAGVEVDVEKRTIRGLAVPYGVVASKGGQRFRFSKGTIRWRDPKRVKVLCEHVRSSAVGHAVELAEDERGLWAVLKVDRSPEGDRALLKAADGTWDGLSIGLPNNAQFTSSRGVNDCVAADLLEISLTPFPAFDDARVSGVAASADEGGNMECPSCGQVHPAGTPCATPPAPPANPAESNPPAAQFSADDFAAFQQFMADRANSPGPEVVPAGAPLQVTESGPYSFDADRGFVTGGEFDFATDLRAASKGDYQANQRVLGFMGEALEFAVTTTNAASLNPSKQRPDLYVDQRQYQYPLWAAVRKESLSEITPIVLPKYNSHSGLVAAHTEGTEPAAGSFSATSQTITPGALSGKAEITRELFDQSGARVSNLIWQKMLQGWFEALEARVVSTLVASAASITDITLTTAGANKALSSEIAGAIAALQYIRGGYTFDVLAAQIDLYTKLAQAVSDTGEPLFPIIAPNNRNGQSASKFASMNVHGVDTFPEWALAGTGTVAASSWLIDREAVWAAASAPDRLEWNFGATVQTNNVTQLAMVTIGIWGYAACAILDLAGLREVVYDPI